MHHVCCSTGNEPRARHLTDSGPLLHPLVLLILQLLRMSRPSMGGGLPLLVHGRPRGGLELEDRLGRQQGHTCLWKQQPISALVHTELDPSTSADSEVIIITSRSMCSALNKLPSATIAAKKQARKRSTSFVFV